MIESIRQLVGLPRVGRNVGWDRGVGRVVGLWGRVGRVGLGGRVGWGRVDRVGSGVLVGSCRVGRLVGWSAGSVGLVGSWGGIGVVGRGGRVGWSGGVGSGHSLTISV